MKYQTEHGEGSLDIWNGSLDMGSWRDAGGETNYGLNHRIAGGKTSWMEQPDPAGGPQFVHGFEAGGPEGSLQAYVGESGATIGVGANVASGAYVWGTAGTGIDETRRFGLSEGEGAAARVGWGDNDHDGINNWAFGMDIGPVSADFKTEDPVFELLDDLSLGQLGQGRTVQDHVGGTTGERVNYTETWGDWAAGVVPTSGTRGAPTLFGDMDELQRTGAALWNPGMNAEYRRRILATHGLDSDGLF